MLCKKACINCVNERRFKAKTEMGDDFEEWRSGWDSKDEENWDKGFVDCIISSKWSINKLPVWESEYKEDDCYPINPCPYYTEQVIFAEEENSEEMGKFDKEVAERWKGKWVKQSEEHKKNVDNVLPVDDIRKCWNGIK